MKRAWQIASVVVVLAACGSPTAQTLADSGVATDARAAGDAGAALDCVGLVACAAKCADADQACLDACGARASGGVVTIYNALVECSERRGCTTAECLEASCNSELNACRGGGGVVPRDGGTAGVGLTTSGKCEITVSPPGVMERRSCWDYSLTVTENHNDGTETFVFYDRESASSGRQTCDSNAGTFTAAQPGPWDSAAISAGNLANKRRACALVNGTFSTATFTEGASCARAGSVGYCAHQVTNVWNPSTAMLTATVATRWSGP